MIQLGWKRQPGKTPTFGEGDEREKSFALSEVAVA